VQSKDFDGRDTSWRLRKHGGNLDQSYYDRWGPANGLVCSPSDPDAVAQTDNATIGVSFDGGQRWTEPGFDFGAADCSLAFAAIRRILTGQVLTRGGVRLTLPSNSGSKAMGLWNILRWAVLACVFVVLGCQRALPPPTENPYLQKLLDTDQPVLLDCWAEWCGPCRQLTPVIDQLAAEYQGRAVVAKLNIDEHPDVAAHLDVSAIPALLLFKNGQLVQRMVGVQPKPKLAAALDELLAAP